MKKTREVTARLVVILLPLLALCATMYAQTGLGNIAGTVTDPSGAVVVGATVTATNVETGVKTTRPSNSTGFYEILQLLPGRYTLEAVAPGFKTFKREGITLQVEDRLTINVPLVLGQSTEVVSITAEAPLLRTQDAQTGEVVDNTFIMNLPQLQRDPLQMLTISGNVQGGGQRANGGAGAAATSGANENDTRINGGRTSGIDYLVDGVSQTSGIAHTATTVTPGMEDVSEFKVITNGMSAEYGRASGGLVELVTKSGSNELHGQLFEYFQNKDLNAGSWYNNAYGKTATVFRQNDFGFALGGPVFIPKVYHGKNKTFFFANYEGVRYSTGGGADVQDAVPAAQRAGDFSGAAYDGILPVLYDQNAPDSTLKTVTTAAGGINGVSYQGCAAATCLVRTVLLGDGLHIPAALMSGQSKNDPTGFALSIQALNPLPTNGGDGFSAIEESYLGSQATVSSSNTFSARIDENITDNQRLYGRFTHKGGNYGVTPPYGALSTSGTDVTPGAWQQQLNYDWTINPTTIFSARVGATFNPDTSGSGYTNPSLIDALHWNPPAPGTPSAQGIMGSGEMPLMNPYSAADATGLNISLPGTYGLSNYSNYEATASLTKILAHQTLKFGFETRRYYDNFITKGSSDNWQGGGWWRFNQDPTSYAVGDFKSTSASEQYANGYAAVLLGVLDLDETYGGTSRATNFNYYAGYVQDDVRVTSKLTLNLGLRWDMETPLTERYNQFFMYDPNANVSSIGMGIAPGFNWNNMLAAAGLPSSVVEPSWASNNALPNGMVVTPGSSQHPGRNITNWHPYQFAPRVGVAYQLTPKTVIRGSFAQMYITTMANPQINSTDQNISSGSFANGGWHTWDVTGIPYAHMVNSFANPYHIGANTTPIGVYTPAGVSLVNANQQMTTWGGNSGSAINESLHMPYELTQSLGIQRELPKGFLVELTWSANQGHNLVGPSYPSIFPKSLYVPQNAATYSTYVPDPFVGTGTGSGSIPLTQLAMAMPEYGTFDVLESNVGRSDYQSLNFRAERRLWQGMTFLFNYTYAKMLDDVGGAEIVANNPFQTGTGGKTQQAVDGINAVYGYSPLDEKSRISATYSIELPFGRGHHFLGAPKGAAQLVADGAIGGWQLAGTGIYRSGRPVQFYDGALNEVDNSVGILETYGNVISNNLTNPNYVQTYYGRNQALPTGAGKFDSSQFLPAASFTYGNVAPIYGNIRQPGNGQIDLSLMKKFPLAAEASRRYLQLRLEASNAFNIRGLAGFNTDFSNPTFGYISAANGSIAGNIERHAQISARIVF